MLKGTIVLIPFPFTDLSGKKIRPALVLHNQLGGEDCIVAFISSVRQKTIGMYDVTVQASEFNGLKVDSVIKVSKIATLQKKIVIGKIGLLESAQISEVNKKMAKLFKIELQ
jgi:mRNA interferase MazF